MSNFYEFLNASASIVRQERTSNTILSPKDHGSLIDITSGTFTQTFTAVATLGNGWWCYLKNSGTGEITLDPNSTETIDGLTSYIMYPGEVRLVQCDGAALRTVVLSAYFLTLTASGTFTKPPGYNFHAGLLWGAGGSGARNTGAFTTGGGGGGACFPFHLAASAIGTTETVTIAASVAGRGTNGAGTAGGSSTFGALATAYGGGAGGYTGAANTYGGTGGGALGVGQTGTATFVRGGRPSILPTAINEVDGDFGGGGSSSSSGGSSFYGGGGAYGGASDSGSVYGGAGGANGGSGRTGGISIFGGNGGGSASGAANAGDGVAPGGGGGGIGQSGTGTSGAGARGELRIWGVL